LHIVALVVIGIMLGAKARGLREKRQSSDSCPEEVFVALKGDAHYSQSYGAGKYQKHNGQDCGDRPCWLGVTREDQAIWFHESHNKSYWLIGWESQIGTSSCVETKECRMHSECTEECPTTCPEWKYKHQGAWKRKSGDVEVKEYTGCPRNIKVTLQNSTHPEDGIYNARGEVEGLPIWVKKVQLYGGAWLNVGNQSMPVYSIVPVDDEDVSPYPNQIIIRFKEGKWHIGKRGEIRNHRGEFSSTSSSMCPTYSNQGWKNRASATADVNVQGNNGDYTHTPHR